MATRFPRPLARRDVLYGADTPRKKLVELGHAYLERELAFDAADFFCQAHDRDGLRLIRDRAIQTGDAFLLRRVQGAAPDLMSRSDWDEIARRAAELGKEVYAARAQAGGVPPPPPLEAEERPEAASETASEGGQSDAAGTRNKHKDGNKGDGGDDGEDAGRLTSDPTPGTRRRGRGRRRRR